MRKRILNIDPDEIKEPEQSPERMLFIEIMNRALEDARNGNSYALKSHGKESEYDTLNNACLLAREAMEFLLTDRSDPFLHVLDIDPALFRESLIRTQHKECTEPPPQTVESSREERRNTRIASENRKRRMFRNNYAYFKEFQEKKYNERRTY